MATAYERLKAMVSGERVTPTAISMWKHFPATDRRSPDFFDRTVGFQRAGGWDFVKISYNGLYSIEDWNVQIKWPEDEGTVGVVTGFAVADAADWPRLAANAVSAGALGREIAVTKALVAQFQGKVPVIGTVFSPLTTAIKMSGDVIFDHMRHEKDALHRGLQTILQTTVAFVDELVAAGVDGIFFATQLATSDRTSAGQYDEFGRRYDMQVLEAAAPAWFNILHIHGQQPLFRELLDYPVAAVNWHDRSTGLSLHRARELTDKILIGGVDENGTLLSGSDEQIESELRDAITQVADGRLILGPGCVVPLAVDERRLTNLGNVVARP